MHIISFAVASDISTVGFIVSQIVSAFAMVASVIAVIRTITRDKRASNATKDYVNNKVNPIKQDFLNYQKQNEEEHKHIREIWKVQMGAIEEALATVEKTINRIEKKIDSLV